MTTEYLASLEALPTAKEETKPPLSGTAKVNISQPTGPPQHLASGFIYGIPDQPNQIPDKFYQDIKFRYSRAGGSQIPGNRGWARSEAEYEVRFESALSNYRTTRKHGGELIWLISDNWGADGGQPKDALWPGDDEDWSKWDALLTRFIADAKREDMIEGLVFDIWNEPDLHVFFNRPVERWLALWSRTYHRLRSELPNLKLTGPSLSAYPTPDHPWWNAFLARIVKDNSIPDQWAWHMESGHDHSTMSTTVATFRDLLARHGIPNKPEDTEININEYATYPEQLPSAGTWWIAQLERENCFGLRGNWAMAGALHDFFGGLLGKPGAGTSEYKTEGGDYWPTAEFQVYKYYATEMTGQRVRTEATPDGFGDVYATASDDGKVVRLLAGSRGRKGQWAVEVVGFGKQDKSEMKVKKLAFPGDVANHFRRYDGPEVLQEAEIVAIKDGRLFLEIDQKDIATAYAFEISAA